MAKKNARKKINNTSIIAIILCSCILLYLVVSIVKKQVDINEKEGGFFGFFKKGTNKLVVYGNKTGERTINSPIKAERGDYLLLHTKHNTIIHNVTRAKMKFEIQKMLINFKEK